MNSLIFNLVLGLLFSAKLCAELQLESYDHMYTKSLIENKLRDFLVKDYSLESRFVVKDDAFALFSTPDEKKASNHEFLLHLSTDVKERLQWRPTSLAGLKIAIDPGHFGGPYARLEHRYVDLDVTLENGLKETLQFDEGTLTLLTALYLKDLLEARGAAVLLTRTKIGEGVLSEDFDSWCSSHPTLVRQIPSRSQLFRDYYNLLDLKARADKINEFKPDFALMIHDNAHDSEIQGSSKTKPTELNFNVAFIAGGFCTGELSRKEDRLDFMRLLVTRDLEVSKELSECIMQTLVERLGVPSVEEQFKSRYLNRAALYIAKGVYARNLFLTRSVHAPLCYGESLIQNNPEEAKRLAKKDIEIHGIPCSSRIKEVAEAYFEGILRYVARNAPKQETQVETVAVESDEIKSDKVLEAALI